MLRRIGYGLGLLFVLACVAAYPLTWGRAYGMNYLTDCRGIQVEFANGVVTVARLEMGLNDQPLRFWAERCRASVRALYRFRYDEETIGRQTVSRQVRFPAWLPALAVSLFMTWRRRRGRRRRAAGFEVGTTTAATA